MRFLDYARYVGYSVASMTGLGIIWIGSRYLRDPGGAAATFGVPNPPPASDPFLLVKGVRDIGTGAILLGLVITRERQGTAVALLAASIIPIGDAWIVRSRGGSASVAFGIHGATAAAMIVGAVALLAQMNAHVDDRPGSSVADRA